MPHVDSCIETNYCPVAKRTETPAWLNEEIVGAAGHCTYPNMPKSTPHRLRVSVCRSTKTVPPAAGVNAGSLAYVQLWQSVDLHQTWTMDFSTMRTVLWDVRFIQVKLFTKQKRMSSSVVILYLLKHEILMNIKTHIIATVPNSTSWSFPSYKKIHFSLSWAWTVQRLATPIWMIL